MKNKLIERIRRKQNAKNNLKAAEAMKTEALLEMQRMAMEPFWEVVDALWNLKIKNFKFHAHDMISMEDATSGFGNKRDRNNLSLSFWQGGGNGEYNFGVKLSGENVVFYTSSRALHCRVKEEIYSSVEELIEALLDYLVSRNVELPDNKLKGNGLVKLEKLIQLAKKNDACEDALERLEVYDTLEEAMQDEDAPAWAFWLRREVEDLPDEVKRQAEQKACEDPELACWLRLFVTDLPENVKRMAEQKACEHPKGAYCLRANVKDLPEEVKRPAEKKACESPEWAYRLRLHVKDLHPNTIKKLKEMDL